jgi:hypothetical protein
MRVPRDFVPVAGAVDRGKSAVWLRPKIILS